MKKFQRCRENFVCDHCGRPVQGNGYTNHCPYCLYSKHVDVNPGDRAAACGGLMSPVWVEKKNDRYIITHQCLQCGHQKKNKTSLADNFEVLILINTSANLLHPRSEL